MVGNGNINPVQGLGAMHPALGLRPAALKKDPERVMIHDRMKQWLLILLAIGITTSVSALTGDELFIEAENRYQNRNYLYALETYNEFIDRYPLSDRVPDAQYRRGVCLFRLNRYAESLKVFAEIEKRYRSTRYFDYIYFWQGIGLYQLGDYSPAVDSLSSFLRRVEDPEMTPQALLYRGLAHVAMESYSAAAQGLAALRQDYPGSPFSNYGVVLLMYAWLKEGLYDSLLALTGEVREDSLSDRWRPRFRFYWAEALWEKGRPEEAKGRYETLLEAEPQIAAVAYRRLFILAQGRGDLAGMQELIQRAEQRFSATPAVLQDMWVRAGIESFRKGSLDQAEYFLLRVWNLPDRRLLPQAVPLYLAEIRVRQKRLAEARELLDAYLRLAPKDTGFTLMRLGDISLQEGKYEEAARYYRQFLDENPGSARLQEARYLLAYSQYRRGYLDAALELAAGLVRAAAQGPQAPSASLYRNAVDLEVAILRQKGDDRQAAQLLKGYITEHPAEAAPRIRYLKLLYGLRDFAGIVTASEGILKEFPRLAAEDPQAWLTVSYLRGLAQVTRKSYRDAIQSLSEITAERVQKAGLPLILPYAQYYLAWSYYRTGSYPQSRQLLLQTMESNPAHPLTARSLYLVGWCTYSLGEYASAADYFARLAQMTDDLAPQAAFLQGKSLLALEKYPDAAQVFLTLLQQFPSSAFAADALFEYAGVLARLGETQRAADSYRSLFQRYPGSVVAGEALYKRGEIYFEQQMYAEARDAFYEYRRAFPQGRLMDSALYWGAQSSLKQSESFGAVLLLEKLIEGFPQSPFRPDALRESAEIYAGREDFRKALNLITRMISEYPAEAQAVRASQMAEEYRYRIGGMGDREAILSATIGQEGGARTVAGRTAMIELARMYIYESGSRMDFAYQMLTKVVEKKDDPKTAAQAQFLLGEYYYRKSDPVTAANEFLKVAMLQSGDPDLAAASIYRAAEMMAFAGKKRDVQELVRRLQERFPDSQWTLDGKKLLESMQ